MAGSETIRHPAPEEIPRFDPGRRNPQDVTQLFLRQPERSRKIKRGKIADGADRKRAERVARHQAPEAALQKARKLQSPGDGLVKEVVGIYGESPDQQPDQRQSRSHQKRRPPSDRERNRNKNK